MSEKIIVGLAGNPNVGKSTVFNALTGMKQHTGNWPGKTVESAIGEYEYNERMVKMYDLPGTYSLIAHSKEEEVTRDFICKEKYDVIVVVCDAVCLERNLNLVLQVLDITKNVIVCVNLIDEAKKKKISINYEGLSKILNVPVIPVCARDKKGLENLQIVINEISNRKMVVNSNSKLCDKAKNELKTTDTKSEENATINHIKKAEEIAQKVIKFEEKNYASRDRKIDKILTRKSTGIPIMLLLLALMFWITIVGANYPSEILFDFFKALGDKLYDIFEKLKVPEFITGVLLGGGYKVLSWVVSVMLPPMAIFFPLFTILEDLGYLPRIAFNMDKMFKKCEACGKQALTMCMGFGCNACGVTGARIIDSPRERLIAIITNNFVPCNGRFPAIISIITMFFVGNEMGAFSSIAGVLILMGVILLGILMTFINSKFLSKTILKGEASSFTLELPPYRAPKVVSVIVRSIFDRTLFVLGRAAVVALPAGILIWLLSNIEISGVTIIQYCTDFLDPFAQLMGLDGVILMAFILGFPANEIVIPIALMAYTMNGELVETSNLLQMKEIFVQNGWTVCTAICTILFSLMHWPCSTTCMTIYKETKSLKWTLVSIVLPTVCGVVACMVVNFLFHVLV